MIGIGSEVKDGKLTQAIRIWKKELTDSGKILKLRTIKDGYVKPSKSRRKILEAAKHREKFRNVD